MGLKLLAGTGTRIEIAAFPGQLAKHARYGLHALSFHTAGRGSVAHSGAVTSDK